MLTYEQKKQRLADLFGVNVADVPDDLDVRGDLSWMGQRRPRALAYTLDELQAMTDPAWIVEGWIPNGLSVIYSKPKAGKTFWSLTVAVCYAMGLAFFGLPVTSTPAEGKRVCYIAAEGAGKSTWRRIARIAAVLKVDMTVLRSRLEVVATGVKIDDPKSRDDFLLLNPGRWNLIVVDTLARCMVGNESDTADMNLAVAGLDHIRSESGAESMIVVHHEGWEKDRLRGSIALFGALDAQIHVVRKDGFNHVEIQELREAAIPDSPGNVMTFRLVDGALELAENIASTERRMWDVLARLYGSAGDRPVTLAAWRAALDDVTPDMLATNGKELTAKAREMRWQRLTAKLVAAGSIKVDVSAGKATTVTPGDPFEGEDDKADFEAG